MTSSIMLGVSDKRLSLPFVSEPTIVDHLELHLSSLSRDSVDRLLKSSWAGRTPIASGLVTSEASCLLSLPSRGQVIAEIQQRIDVAATLGVKQLILAAGLARSTPDGMTVTEGQRIFRALLNSLIPSLEEADICLLLEPLDETETNFIHTLQEAYEIIHDLPRHRMGLVYDLYHSRLGGDRWKEQNRLAAERVSVIHIASQSRGLPRPFGDCWLSRELIDILLSDYSGYLSIEANPEEFYNRSELEGSILDLRRFIEGRAQKNEGLT